MWLMLTHNSIITNNIFHFHLALVFGVVLTVNFFSVYFFYKKSNSYPELYKNFCWKLALREILSSQQFFFFKIIIKKKILKDASSLILFLSSKSYTYILPHSMIKKRIKKILFKRNYKTSRPLNRHKEVDLPTQKYQRVYKKLWLCYIVNDFIKFFTPFNVVFECFLLFIFGFFILLWIYTLYSQISLMKSSY